MKEMCLFHYVVNNRKNMIGVFAGHDHNDDFNVLYEGIYLGYGRKTGYGNYGPPEQLYFYIRNNVVVFFMEEECLLFMRKICQWKHTFVKKMDQLIIKNQVEKLLLCKKCVIIELFFLNIDLLNGSTSFIAICFVTIQSIIERNIL